MLNCPGSAALQTDLSEVTFPDSSEVAALIKVRHDAEDTGRSFTVIDPADLFAELWRPPGLGLF